MGKNGYNIVASDGELTQITPPLPLPFKGREWEGSKIKKSNESEDISNPDLFIGLASSWL